MLYDKLWEIDNSIFCYICIFLGIELSTIKFSSVQVQLLHVCDKEG